MYLLFVWCGTVRSGFEVGKSIARAIQGGENRDSFGPEMATSVPSAYGL
jgi:hypothetical protein